MTGVFFQDRIPAAEKRVFLSRIFTALPPPAQAALFFLAQFAAALDRSRPPGKVLEREAGPFLPSNGRSRFHSRLEGGKEENYSGRELLPCVVRTEKSVSHFCFVYCVYDLRHSFLDSYGRGTLGAVPSKKSLTTECLSCAPFLRQTLKHCSQMELLSVSRLQTIPL